VQAGLRRFKTRLPGKVACLAKRAIANRPYKIFYFYEGVKLNIRSGDISDTGRVKIFCYEKLTTEGTEGIYTESREGLLHREHRGGFIYGMGMKLKKGEEAKYFLPLLCELCARSLCPLW